MDGDGIFLRTSDGLAVLHDTKYDSEALLQEALALYPDVIAGPTTKSDEANRLLLIAQEMGVPDSEAGGMTFRLDHLFVDSNCVPVLVEVKRSSDTRIRREVVGQMLDYAANGVRYWPLALLQSEFERNATARGHDSTELLAQHIGDMDPEQFWSNVQANLTAGRIRMLFVADELPPGLRRVIEFLNEQMGSAEVLGVEVRQFVGDGHTVYVPSVVGKTATAVALKSATGNAWTQESFMDAARARCSQPEVAFIEKLLTDPEAKGGRLSWGRGGTPGVGGWYPINGVVSSLWVLNANNESPTTRAYLVFYFDNIVSQHGPAAVEAVVEQLRKIPALIPKLDEAQAAGWRKWPSVYLPDVVKDPAYEQAVLDATAAAVKATKQ